MPQSSLHLAIIMDGNGRWAQALGLPRLAGHRAGAETLRRVVELAPGYGVDILTVYAFSVDNWKRSPLEVTGLLSLLAHYLESETPRLHQNGIRLSVIGRRDRLPCRLLSAIERAEETTASNGNLHLRLAIDYSGRESIARALEQAAGHSITPATIERLLGAGRPVDLLIRTGGERRLSDFLLWECAYAELVFTPCPWPEFGAVQLRAAILDFQGRDRRFGAIHGSESNRPTPGRPLWRERWLH